MKDGLKRAVLTTVVLAIALGILFLAVMNRGRYSFFDFLRGKELPSSQRGGGEGESVTVIPESVTLPVFAPVEPGTVPGLEQVDREKRLLAENVMPAVVSINTVRRVTREEERPDGSPDAESRTWRREYFQPGLGSGVIVSSEGHVITNEHVVRDVEEIIVTTDDKKQYRAELLGYDTSADIAVLRIQKGAGDFPALPFSDSWKLERGQLVFVAGNPFGLNGSFIGGEVSGELRQLRSSSYPLWQVNADVNPGSSGGPMVDIHGRIVGINKAMLSVQEQERMRHLQGMVFAIRVNDARRVFEKIISEGPPQMGWLGVESMYLDSVLALTWGIDPEIRGAVIVHVVPNSPAQAADLQVADVVFKVDGEPIEGSDELVERVQMMKVGQRAALTVLRKGEPLELVATIAASPNDTISRMSPDGASSRPGKEGVPAHQLTDQELEEMIGIKTVVRSMEVPNGKALLVLRVSRVLAFSPAQGVLEEGDLILSVNWEPVSQVQDFMAKMVTLSREGKGAALFISRNGERSFKVVEPAVKSK